MIKLKEIYNLEESTLDKLDENKKPIKEFALASLAIAFLMKKVILPLLQKKPELKDDLKKEVEKL